MSSAFQTIANGFRNTLLSSKQQEQRTKMKQFVAMSKLATIVTAVVTVLLFAAFHNLFTLCLLGLVGYGCYESIRVINNAQEILNDALVEGIARASKENMYKQMTKNAPIFRCFIEMTQPNIDPWLL